MTALHDIEQVLTYVDEHGVGANTAEVQMILGDTQMMTVRGGSGALSWPAAPLYTDLEVLLDTEPARFWERFNEFGGLCVYAYVPRRLIVHHVVHHGGIASEQARVIEMVAGPWCGVFTPDRLHPVV